MGFIAFVGGRNGSICRVVALVLVCILLLGVAPSEAKKTGARSASIKSVSLEVPENDSVGSNIVVVETNRWKPGKCMWVAAKEDLDRSDIRVVFPYAELFNAVCHVLVGVSDSHHCFIHLTPLTSFFREDTSELEKILANLKTMDGGAKKWTFQVYYFADGGREDKFRSVIARVLGPSAVRFTEMTPSGYAGGEINLVLGRSGLSYSIRDLRLSAFNDASGQGIFNSIPIEAIE